MSRDFWKEVEKLKGTLGEEIVVSNLLHTFVRSFFFKFSFGESMSNTEVSQAILNGKKFLQNRRPLLLGISPGNPHYYQMEALERLFDFAQRNADKVGKRHQSPLTFTANAYLLVPSCQGGA